MAFTRRRFVQGASLAVAATALPRGAAADTYPSKPIRYIVGFAPGGTSDVLARMINAGLVQRLGQPVVIENVPSAGGISATELVTKAGPDGYLVGHTSNSFVTVTPQLIKVPYDPMRELEPIAYLGGSVNVLVVHPDLPVKSMAEFIAYAKANPGKLNYGSSGTATGNHITCEYMKRAIGFDATHVPYKGAGPAINDLLAGRLQFMMDPALMPHIRSGKVRAIAVVDAKTHPALPDLPAIADTVPNWNPPNWYNFISVPAGTPAPVKARIEQAVRESIQEPAVVEKLAQSSYLVTAMSPDALRAKVAAEYKAMGELLRAANISMS